MEPDDEAELDLRAYLAVLRLRWRSIALVTLLVVVVAVGLALAQTPLYQAHADVLVDQQPDTQVVDQNSGQRLDAARTIENEVRFLKSRTVLDQLAKDLGFAPSVAVSTSATADVITVKGTNPDARVASTVAERYAETYLDLRGKRAVNEYLATQRIVQEKISDLQGQIDALATTIDGLDAQIAAGPAATRGGLESQRAQADANRTSLETQQAFYRERLNQIGVTAQLLGIQGAQIISKADVPTSPVSPKPLRNGVLALVLGLMLGVGVAFLREYLDDTVNTKEELERAVALPVVALVPLVGGRRERDEPVVVSLTEPSSTAAEAYRSLRTSVQFLSIDRPIRTLQVTSPVSSEGKTTTVANLAVAFARAGQEVIVVCCDLRRPFIHRFFGLTNDIGFTSVLLERATPAEALQRVPDQPRLRLLASGPHPPNPSELLASPRTAELFERLLTEEGADIVLVDCPPVLPVTDALVLSGAVDATLVVAQAGSTRRSDAARAAELLQQVGAPVVGAVLNGVKARHGYGYGYGYGYQEYTAEGEAPATRDVANAPLPTTPITRRRRTTAP